MRTLAMIAVMVLLPSLSFSGEWRPFNQMASEISGIPYSDPPKDGRQILFGCSVAADIPPIYHVSYWVEPTRDEFFPVAGGLFRKETKKLRGEWAFVGAGIYTIPTWWMETPALPFPPGAK